MNHYQTYGREPFGHAIGPFKDRGDPTGLIIRHGYVVAEWGEPARVDVTYSVTKSFLSLLTGLALGDGLIKSIDDKVAGCVQDDGFKSRQNRDITWRQLLTQTSEWEGTVFGKEDRIDTITAWSASPSPTRPRARAAR